MDVISGSQNDDKIAWYENQTILSVDAVDKKTIGIYHNPAKDTLTIINNGVDSIHTVEILDINGKLLNTQRKDVSQVNVSAYAKGAYFLRIYTDTSVILKKVVKE